MIGKNRLREKLYLCTYDKPGLNRRAVLLKKALDEVKDTLAGGRPKADRAHRPPRS